MGNSVGKRIREARVGLRMSQEDLARRCGWESQGRIGNYERDVREPKRADIEKIAKALGKSPRWLLLGDEDAELVPGPDIMRYVPEISWIQAGRMTEVGTVSLDMSEAKHWPCPVACGPNTYCLRVNGESMMPRFPPGTLLYCDPDVPAIPGKLVIAMCDEDTTATFKLLTEDSGVHYLKALNPEWPTRYQSAKGCRIESVVIFAGQEI